MTHSRIDPKATLETTLNSIERAASAHGRPPGSVALMAVSKTQSPERIAPVLEAGQRLFGENRVQEAQAKWPGLRERFEGIELHLIGPLQTNKVREAVALFDAVDSVDRPRLAEALAAEMARQNRRLPVLVQINTGEEPQKAGVSPKDADAFIDRCRNELKLEVKGLMCVPPVDGDPRPHFEMLNQLAQDHGLDTLSMGMSGDYETAIACGSTCVRLGSALFGERPAPTPSA